MSLRVSQVRRRVGDRGLPSGFDAFVDAKPPVSIECPGLSPYALDRAATKTVVPFAKFSDGDLLAFWYRDGQTPIIAIPGHAAPRLVAIDFDNFLRAINCRQTGMPDLDCESLRLQIPGYSGKPKRTGFKQIQRDLAVWVEAHTTIRPMSTSESAEHCRSLWYEAARQAIRDGLCRVYTLESLWRIYFRVTKLTRGFSVKYRYSARKWNRVPDSYDTEPLIQSLLAAVPDPTIAQFDVFVHHGGLLEVDNGRTLCVSK